MVDFDRDKLKYSVRKLIFKIDIFDMVDTENIANSEISVVPSDEAFKELLSEKNIPYIESESEDDPTLTIDFSNDEDLIALLDLLVYIQEKLDNPSTPSP